MSGPQDGGGFRRPRQAPAGRGSGRGTQRLGLLDGLFRPPAPGSTPMPRLRTSLAHGLLAAFASPGIVGIALGVVAVGWLVVVALGYEGPFGVFVNILAVPPIGTSFDGNLASALFGLGGGLYAIFAFVALRALVLAVLTGMIVDALQVGRASVWSAVRGLRVLPTAFAVSLAGVGLLTITVFVQPLLGAGIGFLVSIAAIVAGVYLFVFAPVIALAEGRRMPDAMSRSIRAARMPGAGNLRFAALYSIPMLLVSVFPLPGGLIGVNPPVAAWLIAFSVNLLHVGLFSTFAFRFLSIAHAVPEAPPARARARARR
jgi:hypothetical protein